MKSIKLLLFILLSSTLLIANNIATITAIKGSATIHRHNSKIDAKLGLKLEEKDNIQTHENTKVQLIFTDETIISLGKNTNFSVEEFLFDDNNEPVARFGMIQGAMRAITGKIGKIAPQKFSVSTKTATIGIRGTNFTIVAKENGSHKVYCTYGKINVTYNKKVYIIQQGYFIDISKSGKTTIKGFDSDNLKKMRIASFGVSKYIKNKLSKTDINGQTKGNNEELLNVTITDDSAVVVQNVTEVNSDNIKNIQDNTKSLSELLASYTMNDAFYDGTYTVTSSDGPGVISSNGVAELSIDFGQDTLTLDLDSGGAIYNVDPSFEDTSFTVIQDNSYGNADGTFSEPTGNDVSGDFVASDGVYSDSGYYDVSSTQTLH